MLLNSLFDFFVLFFFAKLHVSLVLVLNRLAHVFLQR